MSRPALKVQDTGTVFCKSSIQIVNWLTDNEASGEEWLPSAVGCNRDLPYRAVVEGNIPPAKTENSGRESYRTRCSGIQIQYGCLGTSGKDQECAVRKCSDHMIVPADGESSLGFGPSVQHSYEGGF